MVKIGDGVKVYLPPTYGRQDAVVVRVVDEKRRIVNAKIAVSGKIAPGLVYRRDAKEGQGYWVELPGGGF